VEVEKNEGAKMLWMMYHEKNGELDSEHSVGFFGVTYMNGQLYRVLWRSLENVEVMDLSTMRVIIFGDYDPAMYTRFGLVVSSNSPQTRHLLDYIIKCDIGTCRYVAYAKISDYLATWRRQAELNLLKSTRDGRMLLHPLSGGPNVSRVVTRGVEVIIEATAAIGADERIDVHMCRLRICLINAQELWSNQLRIYSKRFEAGFANGLREIREEVGFPPLMIHDDGIPIDCTCIISGRYRNRLAWLQGAIICDVMGESVTLPIGRVYFERVETDE